MRNFKTSLTNELKADEDNANSEGNKIWLKDRDLSIYVLVKFEGLLLLT